MVYIQSKDNIQFPHHFDASCALYGAIDLGLDCRLVTFNDVAAGKYDTLIKNHLFVGSVEFMREVFNRIGKFDVRLPVNSPQAHEIITLKEARNRVKDGQKIFIKPLQIKLFTGFVLDQMDHTCLHGLPDDTLIMASKPFAYKIEAEWRIYVHNHKIIDSKTYAGDFKSNPDYIKISAHISNNKLENFPCAYVIDVGILDGNLGHHTVFIEYNDAWAIGNYGIPNDLYLKMLKDRYFEIVKN